MPVHARSILFWGKFKAALPTAGLLAPVPHQGWHQGGVTHCQAAGTGTEVRAYFAPYLRRVAMPNNRPVQRDYGHGTFRLKERLSHAWTPRRLPAEAFIRRFLQHVLPKGFIKVRYYGILSPHRRPALAQSRALVAACPSHARVPQRGHTRDRHEPSPTPEAAMHCRRCGGQLIWLFHLVPQKRRPP